MKFKKKFYPMYLFIILFIISLYNLSFNNANGLTTENNMLVHFIDVGQGDSILIQVNGKNLLIDSGPKAAKDNLLNYLASLNVRKLDYIIATHPHEDHIGNMSSVIDKFKVESFYAPKISHTTSSFEKMVESLVSKNLKINVIKAGTDTINLGKDTIVTVFSPIKTEYENLNDYSPIIRIQYGDNAFLFTGDAENGVENEILTNNPNIKSDVLKLGHHGSSTSTSEKFFKSIDPSLCIISLGADNKYGHPTQKTLNLLKSNNISFYRTDLEGNIVLSCDGTTISKLD